MRERDLDRELDAVLATYAAVEPREGLEQRVLANLRSPQVRAGRRREWRQGWTAAGVAAAMIAGLLIWTARTGIARKTEIPKASVAAARAEAANPRFKAYSDGRPPEIAKSAGHLLEPVTASGIRKSRPSKPTVMVGRETEPRLAQFPAPQPLDEQEKLLIQFVEQDPQDAALVAQVATERLRRAVEETNAPDSTAGTE